MTTPTTSLPNVDPALFDTSEWPLVYGRFPELHEPDRVSRILDSLDGILALKQPFVMAWIPPSHDHDDEPHEDEKRSVLWIKQRKADLRQHCRGYLYVTGDPELRELLEGRLNQVRKMYGFAMVVVHDKAAARAQARELLHPSGA
ncbi:hypothetical protein G7048_28125 (plasmid) [Diaphorobacter sp. HDW4B]|uniref:hypothetical protein n=1 Tax=Diaphorobacter sp. HDW4B TaxID=2714925 RepID=UPI00140B781C|nr:hypothetical protein [Diaphorobacter sp. HDW4B]QIL74330.1 hypothetical protein G7048_28125 [Diaphorobacter sp. HDW4B]